MTQEITNVDANVRRDWTKREIMNALEDVGTSVRAISIANGKAPGTYYMVWNNTYRKAQEAIANALELSPEEIWPSRYQPKKGRCDVPNS
ncbi:MULTISPECIES: helix-turn-helix domain-containing protein [Vibrio]|uniref:Negative regulator of transcription n=2 Tax=Vibrio TaxID=662 RepID=A0A1E3WH58_9VIBR|nr:MULTISPECIES: helix-turn-helix domain-containing protein [Vibrio]EGU38567.1 putative DNA-binding protein [Vibrio ichthyoenteri ATCC 700023]ODS05145.1 Negative regulator of transcription [Vibrio scophthalmi]